MAPGINLLNATQKKRRGQKTRQATKAKQSDSATKKENKQLKRNAAKQKTARLYQNLVAAVAEKSLPVIPLVERQNTQKGYCAVHSINLALQGLNLDRLKPDDVESTRLNMLHEDTLSDRKLADIRNHRTKNKWKAAAAHRVAINNSMIGTKGFKENYLPPETKPPDAVVGSKSGWWTMAVVGAALQRKLRYRLVKVKNLKPMKADGNAAQNAYGTVTLKEYCTATETRNERLVMLLNLHRPEAKESSLHCVAYYNGLVWDSSLKRACRVERYPELHRHAKVYRLERM